jgi:hypothetical protein
MLKYSYQLKRRWWVKMKKMVANGNGGGDRGMEIERKL